MPLYSFMFCASFSQSYVTLFEFNFLLFSETKNCFTLYIPIIEICADRDDYLLRPMASQQPQHHHSTVNHSQNFVDSNKRTCTNAIEAYWSRVKRHVRVRNTKLLMAGKVKTTCAARTNHDVKQAGDFLPDLTLNFFKSQMKAFSNRSSQNMRPMYRG